MLSAIITALLLGVMLLIITAFLIGAWREYSRHKQKLATQLSLSAHPLDRHVTAILHLEDGKLVAVEKLAPSFSLPSSWYTRRRTLVSIGFLVMLLDCNGDGHECLWPPPDCRGCTARGTQSGSLECTTWSSARRGYRYDRCYLRFC